MAVASISPGVARCGGAALLFGATVPLASLLAEDTSAPVLAGLLYLGAAIAVLPVVLRQRPRWDALRRGGPRLAVAVGAGGFLGPLLLALGLSRTPAATASLLLNLELVATTILASLVFGEHLGRRVKVGTAIVVGAGAVVASSDIPELRVGALLIIGACLCWGLDNGVTAGLVDVTPAQITLAKGVFAGAANLGLGVMLGGRAPGWANSGAALAVGALGYGLSITLWVRGARDIGAARGQLVFSAAPFIGVLVAWVTLGDPVRPAEILALVLAAGGVACVVGSGHEHVHDHPTTEHDHEHGHDDQHHGHSHPVGVNHDDRHAHVHLHLPDTHAHPHMPDVHHRHDHADA
jgi:drug/metabolite transporter (DMT)-like permease